MVHLPGFAPAFSFPLVRFAPYNTRLVHIWPLFMLHHRPRLLLVLLSLLLLVALAAGLMLGTVPVSLTDVLVVIGSHLGVTDRVPGMADLVIWEIRLPRVLLSVLVGAALALSGALVQGLFRNPLADPSLIGVSGGAAVGAAFAIVLGGAVSFLSGPWMLPLLAFAGGAGVTALVYRLGVSPLGTSVATMLLAGVAINAMTGACISYLSTVAEDARLRNLIFWLMGSFNTASWTKVAWVLPFTLLSLLMIPRLWKGLNALLLGESEARHLGFSVERLRREVILVTALAVGAAVAAVGMIGFVGLVVPHIVRLLLGPDHRWLLPCTALLGATLLCLADVAARMLVQPQELAIGVLTALLGAPFFLFLIVQRRKGELYGA